MNDKEYPTKSGERWKSLYIDTGIDITNQVKSGLNDDELLPITRCICGHEFQQWDFVIGLGPDSASQCPHCDRWLYFSIDIRIFEGKEPN